MKPISTTEAPFLEFDVAKEETTKKINAVSNKIGWLRSISDKPGAKFDITIKDGLGRIKMQKKDLGGETNEYGELLNLETMLGEELEVSVENVRGADSLKLFVN